MAETLEATVRPEATDTPMHGDASATSDALVFEIAEPWLVIGTGVQAGARARLQHGESVSLGRSRDNHIVLRDASVGDARIDLRPDLSGLAIRVLDGCITVGDEVWEAGREGRLPFESDLSLGAVDCRVDLVDPEERASQRVGSPTGSPDDSASAESSLFPGPDRRLPAGLDAPDDVAAALMTSATTTSRPSLWQRRGGTILAALVLLGGIGLGIRGAMTPPTVERMPLAQMMSMTPFAALEVSEQADGRWQIGGFLDTADEAAELERLVQRSGYAVDNRVVVGEHIETQVSDIFRVNDVAAEVSVADGGTVSVQSRTADEARLRRVEKQVLEDVPGIAGLSVDNQPPPVTESPEPIGPMDPGKRVAMVVSDAPAHIITEDRSRYFVGALLPSGHRVASIDQGRVMLEKRGVETVLEF